MAGGGGRSIDLSTDESPKVVPEVSARRWFQRFPPKARRWFQRFPPEGGSRGFPEGGSRGFRRWFLRKVVPEVSGNRGRWFQRFLGTKVVPEVSGNGRWFQRFLGTVPPKVVPEVSEGGSRGFWERFHDEGGSTKVVPEVPGNEEKRYPQSSVIESQGTLVTAWIART
jgi:hypothetical protein